jgi:hypothetical protein
MNTRLSLPLGLTPIVLAALLVAAPVFDSRAANITVTTTVDEVNGNTTSIANLIATPGGAGISLREAIIAANNTAGADTITLPAGTYTLTITNAAGGNEDACARGDLDVTDSLTITGAGAATTIIQAGTTAANGIDKVLAINPICDHAVAFAMSGVTIRFGRNTQPFGASDFSFTGGGIDWCGHNGGSFTLTDCVISDNTNVNGYGGGLNIDEVGPSSGLVTIANTVFVNNTSTYSGGAMNVYGDNVRVTITGSAITNNHTLGTGGVFAGGGGMEIRITNQNDNDGAPTPSVTIGNSIISGNTGVGGGGGIDVASTGNQDVTITNTAITGNSVIVAPGGVSNTIGGGLSHNNHVARTTLLSNVLIANNQSAGSATSLGGGVSHGGGTLTIRNSTISGNSARDGGGGIYVTTDPQPLTLINTTISNNRADSDNTGAGVGGGIYKLAGTSTVTLQNTLCDGNFKGTGSAQDEINGAVTANFSLVGNTTGATVTGANNQLNVSARLAALANNGGQTVGPAGFTAVLQTHALLAGSPALDTGSNALVPAALTTDQRGTGFARILDAADADTTAQVDIGSYEAHPSVQDIANQTLNEDGSLGIVFNVGDAALGFTSITASSGNTTLVPNNPANLALSGSGSSRTLTINPATNQFGSATITVTANATVNSTAQSMTDTFILTVSPIADIPSGTSATTPEDTQTSSGLVLSRNPVDGAEVTHFKITGITGGTLFKHDGSTAIANNQFITFAEGNAGLRFTPSANLNTPAGDTFGFTVQAAVDSSGTGISPATNITITVTEVNDAPTGTNDSLSTIAEDSGPRTNSVASLLANDSKGPANESGQTLTIINVGSAVGGTVSLIGANVVFTPTADFNGPASYGYTLQDNGTTAGVNDFKTSTATVSFTISEVNDPPVGVNDTLSDVPINSGTRTNPFTTFLANDSKGPPNESSQVLTIIGIGSAVGGAVSIAGANVLFTPTSNYFGPASFVYTLQDNGTTAGVNDFKTSTATASFNILAVPPTITCPPNITTNPAPGGCQQTVAFSATIVTGAPPPTLTYKLNSAVITSPYMFPRGTNIVTVTASNGAPPNATCSFSVTVLSGPAPQLTYVLKGTNLILSWPSGFSCYTLQFTPALLSPPSTNVWTVHPGPFIANGTNLYVTNGISATNRFFRLAF